MSSLHVNPHSELIREPELLVPGSMPPTRLNSIDRNNKFGRFMHSAYIPGWDVPHGNITYSGNSVDSDRLVPIGDQNMPILVGHTRDPGIFNPGFNVYTATYKDRQPIIAAEGNPQNTNVVHHFRANNRQVAFNQPYVTVVGIVKPNGDGTIGGSADSRIWSVDQGGGEQDHDYMIGFVRSPTRARARIRLGSTTYTMVPSGTIQSNAWNLIAGVVAVDNVQDSEARCLHLREDGGFSQNVSTYQNAQLSFRTSTNMAMYCLADTSYTSAQNAFDGTILGVWLFDGLAMEEADLREFFANPWQVFDVL